MTGEHIVHVRTIACPSCGLHTSGYLEVVSGSKGVAVCPRCGTKVIQPLPPHFVEQLAPADYESPVHPSARPSNYPGLYNEPKHHPRLHLSDVARASYAPRTTFPGLYLSTDLPKALALVIVFSVISVGASALVSAGASRILNYDPLDVLDLTLRAFVSWVVTLFTFLVLGLVAALVAKHVFAGRGERSMTITLLGYCFPAYALLSILLLAIFEVGFHGLSLGDFGAWTSSERAQALAAGLVLFFVAIGGLIWLVWMTSRAVSVANDVTPGEGALSIVLAAIPASVIFLVVGAVMRLPIGLFA